MAMEPTYYSGIYEHSFNEFKTHFDKEENERIIFSARFGMGKTTFLKDFFKDAYQDNWATKYQVFRLFPVNYSISNNEDILQYIKYDIIFELLASHPDLDKSFLEVIKNLPEFVLKNLDKVAASLIYMIPKIGKDVVEAYERIDKLKDEFLAESKSTGEKMVDYLEKIHSQQGGLYEYDVLTKLISETPPTPPYTKKVLIVDDIDRLDPEHVFRILNVFAAHFDNTPYKNGNKFNFDKVIIVCDFNNIKEIFKHRYGPDTDFMGYIDKFYSSEIFRFDNHRAIAATIESILYEIQPKVAENDTMQVVKQIYIQDGFAVTMVTIFLKRKLLSFRNLLKIRRKQVDFQFDNILDEKDYKIFGSQSRIAIRIKLLVNIMGDVDHFLKSIEQCAERNEPFYNYEEFTLDLFVIMLIESHKMQLRKAHPFTFNNKKYSITVNNGSRRPIIKNLDSAGEPIEGDFIPTIQMFWNALIATTLALENTGYLK
jgi:KAP family P-loop domain